MRLENKVALISDGARGMGATEAKLFARKGAKVVIGDVLEEDPRRTEAEINETGGECIFVRLDVTDENQWENAVSETVARFGRLDILVNNAGIARVASVEDTTESEWDLVMGINAKVPPCGRMLVSHRLPRPLTGPLRGVGHPGFPNVGCGFTDLGPV